MITNTEWRTGTPDVEKGKQGRFWCAFRAANGKVHHRLLCYCNAHVMPISELVYDDAPKGAVPVGDDGDYAWTGWFEESCEHCETQWAFTEEVIAWTLLPRFEPTP